MGKKDGSVEERRGEKKGIRVQRVYASWDRNHVAKLSLSLFIYLWIPQIFRRSDGQQIWIMYLQNLTNGPPTRVKISSFFLHARGWILSILAFRILEDGFSPLPLFSFDKLCLNSETSGRMILRIDPPPVKMKFIANFLSS